MTNQQQEMIEYTIQDIVSYFIDDYGMAMEEALDQTYLSDSFKKLADPETGLYLEGSAYVYELIKRERKNQVRRSESE
ncbi:MAG: hypothetical protein U0M33_09530 [Lachnospiraceae bacterium]|nr:hypothetical protein [Lachnospiraceae bacterium]